MVYLQFPHYLTAILGNLGVQDAIPVHGVYLLMELF